MDSIPASLQLHSPTITMPNLRLSLVYGVDAADKIAEPGNVFFLNAGKLSSTNTFIVVYITGGPGLKSHGVAVRPKITTPPPRTSKCLPWGRSGVVVVVVRVGGSSPKYTCLLASIQLDVCLNRNESKKEKRKK